MAPQAAGFTLAALGRPIPPDRHGVNLLPVLADPAAPPREYALSGVFGKSVSLTDGRWVRANRA